MEIQIVYWILMWRITFNDSYKEEDFFNISVFQDEISGRRLISTSGGTGLSLLIKSLQEMAEENSCYMLSGKRVVWFRDDTIAYNSDHWLGFNKESNYLSSIPDNDVISYCAMYIPGTGYNLNFVIKSEEKEDE